MLSNQKIILLGFATFLISLCLFAVFLNKSETAREQESSLFESKQLSTIESDSSLVNANIQDAKRTQNVELFTETESVEKDLLNSPLQLIKEGKRSVMSLVFSDDSDLDEVISNLLTAANSGEAWANYALGQMLDTCGELSQKSEPELIEMFSNLPTTNVSVEQQNAMNQLLPIVINASKRCRSIDKNLLSSLGGDSQSWFETGVKDEDLNSFLISGFSVLDKQLKAENDAYQNAQDDERWKLAKELRAQAKSEYKNKITQIITQKGVTPENLINISEHLNLIFDEDSKFKSREAWMIAACDMGYENQCGASSATVQLMCMFSESCQSGTDLKQGIVWKQGQFKFDQQQQLADEIKILLKNQQWSELGFVESQKD